jgi:TolB-like protein
MQFSISIRLRAKVISGVVALTTAAFSVPLVAAECSTTSPIADDSISIFVTAVSDSERATNLSWLIDQGLEQLLHKQLVVTASPERIADKDQRECPISVYRLTGAVEEDDEIARVAFQLTSSALSDVLWMESYDRHAGGDIKAVADELAYEAAKEIIKIVSGEIE